MWSLTNLWTVGAQLKLVPWRVDSVIQHDERLCHDSSSTAYTSCFWILKVVWTLVHSCFHPSYFWSGSTLRELELESWTFLNDSTDLNPIGVIQRSWIFGTWPNFSLSVGTLCWVCKRSFHPQSGWNCRISSRLLWLMYETWVFWFKLVCN